MVNGRSSYIKEIEGEERNLIRNQVDKVGEITNFHTDLDDHEGRGVQDSVPDRPGTDLFWSGLRSSKSIVSVFGPVRTRLELFGSNRRPMNFSLKFEE